jgi:hypothetical protein
MQIPTHGTTLSAPAHAHSPSVGLARTHVVVARIVLAGVFVQVFFAGLGIFTSVGFFPHVILGTLLVASSFSLPVIAGVGHLGQSQIRRSWLLAGLMILQGLLIDAGRLGLVYVSALHPVNALVVLFVTLSLADVTGFFARWGVMRS